MDCKLKELLGRWDKAITFPERSSAGAVHAQVVSYKRLADERQGLGETEL